MRGILVVLRSDLDSPWGARVSAFDACGSGRASAAATASPSVVSPTGVWAERWRCKFDWGRAARL
eukprot:15432304-Alexandrium_andersonii.AAC.1